MTRHLIVMATGIGMAFAIARCTPAPVLHIEQCKGRLSAPVMVSL